MALGSNSTTNANRGRALTERSGAACCASKAPTPRRLGLGPTPRPAAGRRPTKAHGLHASCVPRSPSHPKIMDRAHSRRYGLDVAASKARHGRQRTSPNRPLRGELPADPHREINRPLPIYVKFMTLWRNEVRAIRRACTLTSRAGRKSKKTCIARGLTEFCLMR
jgi:hypothetical protein